MNVDQQDESLQERLARLEAENAALRARVESPPPVAPSAKAEKHRVRGRWWTVLAVVLVLLGCLLAPLAVIGGWGKSILTDTDAFVATYAQLARDPAVQSYIVDEAATAINAELDVEQLTSDVIDGIKSLGVRPRASAALDALKAPATQGIQDLIRDGISAFVASEAFVQTWERALRISHTQLLATLRNDPNALLAASSDGSIGIQLGPIVEDVKAALLARGINLASRIPAIERTIPIAQSDQIPTVQAAYRAIIAVGPWLPWVALILLTAGVLVARRRSVALVWTAIGLSLSMLVLLLAFASGRAVLLTAVPAALVHGNGRNEGHGPLRPGPGCCDRPCGLVGRPVPSAEQAARFLQRRHRRCAAQRRAARRDDRPGGRLGVRAAPGAARHHCPRRDPRPYPASAAFRSGDHVDASHHRASASRPVVCRAPASRRCIGAAGRTAPSRGMN